MRRLFAVFLDTALGVAFVAALVPGAAGRPWLGAVGTTRGCAVLCAIGYVYTVVFESLPIQATLGKVVAGIRVEPVGTGRVRLRAAALRNFLRIIDLLPGVYIVGGVAAIRSASRQRVGDRAASCVVVRHPCSVGARVAGLVVVIAPVTVVAIAASGRSRPPGVPR